MSPKNTTKQGNDYRDRVAEIFGLTPGYTNVAIEHRIGSQDVDVYYEEQTSVGVHKVACECKDYKDPLTKSYIKSEIFPNYYPLLKEGHVDAVRIIAPLEIGPNAQAYVADCGFHFSTDRQTEAALIDFGPYLKSLSTLFDEGGLSEYYVNPVLEDGVDLETKLFGWIRESSGAQPIAILAGYGMGKTSLARRMAAKAAEQHSIDRSERIPILIPLAQIASEQDLEGLLGKILSAQNVVRNYHFGLFMELNKRGRFFVILDGFDEMKHTMSWREFRHNFTQLNRLVSPNSRVLLLGRPSALLSDAEELFVLRGLQKKGNRQFEVPGAPEFKEVQLQRFSEDQAINFMSQYASYQASNSLKASEALSSEDFSARIDHIRNDDELKELIGRPVQAKMLADLAVDPNVEWRSFTRFELYEEFIERITQRESVKPTRQVFSEVDRVRFIRDIAWWLWRRSNESGFLIDDVSRSLIARYVSNGEEFDGVRRDLLAGSLLERKPGDSFYFPHRSFLEFLVAQHIAESDWTDRNLADVSESLNPEIIAFLQESGTSQKMADWAIPLNEIRSPVSAQFLQTIAWAMNDTETALASQVEPGASPRDLLISYFRRIARRDPVNEAVNFVAKAMQRVSSSQTRITALLCILFARESSTGALHQRLGLLIVARVIAGSLAELSRVSSSNLDLQALDHSDPFVHILASSFKGKFSESTGGALRIEVDFSEFFFSLRKLLDPKYRLQDAEESITLSRETVEFSELSEYSSQLALNKKGGAVTAFFRKHPDPSELVTVTSKRSTS